MSALTPIRRHQMDDRVALLDSDVRRGNYSECCYTCCTECSCLVKTFALTVFAGGFFGSIMIAKSSLDPYAIYPLSTAIIQSSAVIGKALGKWPDGKPTTVKELKIIALIMLASQVVSIFGCFLVNHMITDNDWRNAIGAGTILFVLMSTLSIAGLELPRRNERAVVEREQPRIVVIEDNVEDNSEQLQGITPLEVSDEP